MERYLIFFIENLHGKVLRQVMEQENTDWRIDRMNDKLCDWVIERSINR